MRRILALAMLVAALGMVPSHAETTGGDGSVMLMKPSGTPDHDSIQYYLGGCSGNRGGVFETFIDMRQYVGKTLHFTPMGADVIAVAPPNWNLTFASTCGVRTVGTSISTTTSAALVVPQGTLFLSLTFFTSGVVNAHYKLEVL